LVVVEVSATDVTCDTSDQKVSRGANRSVVKQVSAFVLGELLRQKHERYMVHIAYIYSVA
jgi:hypothetical protein